MNNLDLIPFDKKLEKKDIPLPSKNAIGDSLPLNKIKVFTEWAPVKSVIIGYMGESSNFPDNDEIMLLDVNEVIQGIEFSKDVIKRAQDIQNNVVDELMKRGINVVRVADIDCKKQYKIGDKLVSGFHTFSSRDIVFFYDDTAYEVPSITISRQNEHCSFYWILDCLRKMGSKWYSSFVCPYSKEAPLFEAANLIRAGMDILFQISVSGNYSGFLLFKSLIDKRYNNKVRVHPIYVYDGVHIDTTLTVLGFNKKINKYIVLANPERVNKYNTPALFRGKNWAILYGPEPVDQGYEKGLCMSSTWISLNIFVVNPELILMDDAQPELVKYFNYYGIETIQVKHELGRTVCGGMHCMTNEFSREEDIDFSSILSKNENLSIEEEAGYFDPELLTYLKKKSNNVEDWVEILNSNNKFPNVLFDHLNETQKRELEDILSKSCESYLEKYTNL